MSKPSVKQLRIVAPYQTMSGYSKASRAVLRLALVAGYEVQAVESDLNERNTRYNDGRHTRELYIKPPAIPLPDVQAAELKQAIYTRVAPDAPTLLIQLPGNLSNWKHYADGPLLGWTMTESDNLCAFWQHGLRSVDLALAPSQYVLDTFRRAVPETPSHLLPLPVDDRLWSPDEYKEEIRRIDGRPVPPFLFLSIFQTSQRKKWREILVAFSEEFADESDHVGLVLKPTSPAEVWPLYDNCREMGAWIGIDQEKRTDWTLGGLYRACNVYVQPTSEGFGLTYIEAGLCGLPSIALDGGGAADVVDEASGYTVPHFMEPLIGHMPQVYNRRTDKFASFDIDDLRASMRRAYDEEKAGAQKGVQARARALQEFTPDAIAPQFREAVEMCVDYHARSVVLTVPPIRPHWATVAGAWGDVMCCIGSIRAMMANKELEKIGVIFYGRDPKIADWLHAQPWCSEVLAIIEPDKKEMERVFARICQVRPEHGRQMFYDLLESKRGVVLTGQIAFTQLCLAKDEEPEYWRGAVLPMEAHAWADSVRPEGKFLLLNPFSIASNKLRDHWPHWGEATEWLCGKVTVPLVLVGEQAIEAEHPSLVNLSGQSRTMMDVLALAERAAGIITTGNNLGIYAPIAGVEAVVVIARTAPKGTFYHRWYEHPGISLVEFEDTLSDFETAVSERFGKFVGEEAEKDLLTEAGFYGHGRA